jgi:preprotein translocase subunit SecF
MKSNKGLIITTALLVIGAVGFYLWKINKDKKGSANGTADVPSDIALQIEDLQNQLNEAKAKNDTVQASKIAQEIKNKTQEAYSKGLTAPKVGDKVNALQDLNAYFDPQMKNVYKPSFKKGDYIGAYVGKENAYLSKVKRKRSGISLKASYDDIFVPTSKITRS